MAHKLLTSDQRALVGAGVGGGLAVMAASALITPAGLLYWGVGIGLAAIGSLAGAVILNSHAADEMFSRLVRSEPLKALARADQLGGEAVGAMERASIPALLAQLSAASENSPPEVKRAAVRVLDAGKLLLSRLSAQPHMYVASRQAFAHRIPAAIETLEALNDADRTARRQMAAQVAEALEAVAASIEQDGEVLAKGEAARMTTALDIVDTTVGKAPASREAITITRPGARQASRSGFGTFGSTRMNADRS